MRHRHPGKVQYRTRRGRIKYRKRPIHSQMNKYKNLNYKQLRKKFNIHPLRDDDDDKVPNYKDCRPWDNQRQDEEKKERMSAYSYEEWARQSRVGRSYEIGRMEDEIEEINNNIKRLSEEILEEKEKKEKLNEKLKTEKEKENIDSKESYEVYVDDSRRRAEREGYEWVPPD